MNTTFNKGLSFSLLACMLSLIQSCNYENPRCGEGEGEVVECWQPDKDRLGGLHIEGTYCSERDFPPCVCLNKDNKDILSKFKYRDQCGEVGIMRIDGDQPVTPTGPDNANVSVDQPYEFTCAVPGTNSICPEFDTYYFDFSENSYDRTAFRSVYVQLSIADFDLENYNYEIRVTNPSPPGIDLSVLLITKDNIQKQLIRYFEQQDCLSSPCPALINIQLLTSIIPIYSYDLASHELVLSRIEHNTQNKEQLARGAFTVRASQDRIETRVFNLIVYGNEISDLSSHTIDKYDFLPAIQHVFGEGKSNLRFAIPLDQKLTSNSADNVRGNLKLRTTDFYNPNFISQADIIVGLRQWAARVTSNEVSKGTFFSFTEEGYGFAVEVNQIVVIDPRTGIVDADVTEKVKKSFNPDILGITLASESHEIYYNSSYISR